MPNQSEGFNTKSVDVQQLTEQELKFGYWFVTHREQLRRLLIGFLVAFCAITYGYALFALIRFYGFEYESYRRGAETAGQTYINIEEVHQSYAIQPLEVVSRQVISGRGQSSDIAVLVRNPNTKWALERVSYQFSIGGRFLQAQETYFLPGEEKYLLALNQEGIVTGTPQVFFENEEWQRVTNYEQWAPDYLNFLITNKRFLSSRQSELSDQLPVSEVTATIANATAYNYVSMEVQVALFTGNRLAAIDSVVIPDFPSGVSKPLSVRFTQNLSAITTVQIIPSVNILDRASFSSFQGEFDPGFREFDQRRRF